MKDPGDERAHGTIVESGAGPALVLMHGTLMDHRMFEPQLEGLAGVMRVIAYDSRARTPAGLLPYDMDDLVDDCQAVLDAAGVQRAVIGGMSMGSFVALHFAVRHPDRVAGLVLIGGQASGFATDEREYWGERYRGRLGVPVGQDFAAEDRDFNFFSGVDAREPGLRQLWYERFAGRDGTAMDHEVQSWLGMADLRDQLPAIEVPSLIIHGDRDASIPVEAALEMYRLLPDSDLLVLPETGHAANLERPREVNLAIIEFMERTS